MFNVHNKEKAKKPNFLSYTYVIEPCQKSPKANCKFIWQRYTQHLNIRKQKNSWSRRHSKDTFLGYLDICFRNILSEFKHKFHDQESLLNLFWVEITTFFFEEVVKSKKKKKQVFLKKTKLIHIITCFCFVSLRAVL